MKKHPTMEIISEREFLFICESNDGGFFKIKQRTTPKTEENKYVYAI